jgi:hypothetical protein
MVSGSGPIPASLYLQWDDCSPPQAVAGPQDTLEPDHERWNII